MNFCKKLLTIIYLSDKADKILPFFSPKIIMKNKKIKNIKISDDAHSVLKTYCEKNGLKLYKFLENLIIKTCSKPKDIYGED